MFDLTDTNQLKVFCLWIVGDSINPETHILVDFGQRQSQSPWQSLLLGCCLQELWDYF